MPKRPVDEVLRKIHKKYGETIASLGDKVAPVPRIPCGVLAFDIASGGGFPCGHISCIWGDKDTGKSTMLYTLIANYQRLNPKMVVAMMDLEDNYDSQYGGWIGVDDGRLLRLQPDYAEMGIDMTHQVIKEADDVGLVAVDGFAGLVPSKEMEASAEDHMVGTQGLLMARFSRKTSNLLSQVRRDQGRLVTVVGTNQMRMKIGGMGDPSTMPGGKAFGHYVSMILRLWRGKEKIKPDVNPNRPVVKEILGVIEKKKGRTVARKFEFEVAIEPHNGLHAGQQTDEWRTASVYLNDMGVFGKREDGKGWIIMGNEFPRKADCQEWYEQHRDEAREAIIGYLLDHPEDV